MVTHDATAAAVADRVLFLADGLVVKDVDGCDRHTILERSRRCLDDEARRNPGTLSRKLRTTLTALAVVFGVAMVSGTFVLTDTISQAFNSLFSTTYKNASAVISGGRSSRTRRAATPRFPTRC